MDMTLPMCPIQQLQRLRKARRGHRGGEGVRDHRQRCETLRGFTDRPIAGASAQVAFDAMIGQIAVVTADEQAHDETRRAIAALRPGAVDQQLLRRMQALAVSHAFDRHNRPAASVSTIATVHAPQSPSPHPSLVPDQCLAFSQRSNDSVGSAPIKSTARPFNKNWLFGFMGKD